MDRIGSPVVGRYPRARWVRGSSDVYGLAGGQGACLGGSSVGCASYAQRDSSMGSDPSPRKRPMRRWRLLVLSAACIAVLGVVALDSIGGPGPAPPAPPAPVPPAAWLGLNYNSGGCTGSLTDFAARGIVYDREGAIEVEVGQTPENAPGFKVGLDVSYTARMIPDIEVDPASGPPGCDNAPDRSKTCLPTTEADIGSLVRGFIQTAGSVLHDYPGKTVLFE